MRRLIPIAETEFTNSCACRIPPLPALSPLVKGGEGRGEGGFESCAFTNFGGAVGIITSLPCLQLPYNPSVGIGAGGVQVLSKRTCAPDADESLNASMMSSTWYASCPFRRFGRPSWRARIISASPKLRYCSA